MNEEWKGVREMLVVFIAETLQVHKRFIVEEDILGKINA